MIKRILVMSQRYEENRAYVDVSTDEQLHAASLKLLEARFLKDEEGDGVPDPNLEEYDVVDYGMTIEEVMQMKDCEAKNVLMGLFERNEENRREYNRKLETKKMAEEIFAKKDGERAWAFLKAKSKRDDNELSIREVLDDCPTRLARR